MSAQTTFHALSKGLWCLALSYLLVWSLISPPAAQAWGDTGHEAVAWVTWQQLKPQVKTRVLALLKLVPTLHNSDGTKSIPGYKEWVADLPSSLSQDQQNAYLFMRAATWPDTIKHEWLHDSDTPPKNVTVDDNIGFTDTASHGYWHFIDAAFSSDKTKPPATPAPNVVTQIGAFRTAIASSEDDQLKAYDMIWLEHIVGDIHQPLHGAVRYYAGKGDVGGNSVKVSLPAAMKKTFEGNLSKSAPSELHAFWDDLPGEGSSAATLPVAASFAGSLPAAKSADVAIVDPQKWADESLTMAKTDSYAKPIGKSPTPPAPSKSYLMTQAYYDQALLDAKGRIALAGARLAKLLNENLQ